MLVTFFYYFRATYIVLAREKGPENSAYIDLFTKKYLQKTPKPLLRCTCLTVYG